MPQTYRLRLGDGTILKVDHDGLSTWETDSTAAVGTRNPNKWIPLKEFLVQERAAAYRRAREERARKAPSADLGVSIRADGLPLIPPPPPREAEQKPSDFPGSNQDPAPIGEPEGLQVLAEETAPPVRIAEPADLPVIPLKAATSETPAPPAVPVAEPERPGGEPEPSVADLPVIPLKAVEDEVAPPPPALIGAEWEEPSSDESEPPVHSLAEDPAPLDPPVPRGARARATDLDLEEDPLRLDGRSTSVIQAAATFGSFLSRCLRPINRMERGLPPFVIDDTPAVRVDPSPPRPGGRSPAKVKAALVRAYARLTHTARGIPPRARGWLEALAVKASRLADGDGVLAGVLRREPSTPAATLPEARPEPIPWPVPEPLSEPPLPSAAALTRMSPPETGPPPPSTDALPVLRLAPVPDPPERGDVYDGPIGDGVGVVLWSWTRRVTVVGALLAGGAFAALHWEAWSPRAANLGGTVFEEIDGQVRTLHLARERQEVVDQAAEQLPHLTRDTIRLVVARYPAHVPELPGVFEMAWGAAERGTSTLSASEAEELAGLRQELLEALRPLDRDRLQAFGRAYARGAVFPFDARRGLAAYARGARALPPERRARLQTLLGKAIAAGLAS